MDGTQFDALARRMARATSRRRLVKGIAGGLTALIAGGAATRQASARTITICHFTGNPSAPVQSLTIDQAEFNLHARHGDYMRVECCSDADCPNQYGSCGTGVCQSGYCAQIPVAAGTSCDDGSYCNGDAICDGAFTCVPEPEVNCPDTGNPCTANVCDESTRGCVEVMANEGSRCGGSWCEPDVCRSGACVTEPVTCPSTSDPCTIIRCDESAQGCIQVPNNEGGRCGGDPCEPAFCRSGTCSSEPIVCTPVDQCHTSSCNAANGQCDSGVSVNAPCTTGDSQQGLCNSAGVCVAQVSCTDGIKNGSETDVDCGGDTCPRCTSGKMCLINADCESNHCISGLCTGCPANQTDCGGRCVDLANDPSNCGACGIVCPGYMQPNDNVTCQSGSCTFSCQGEYYDVDGNESNGCEVHANPTGSHTQGTALNLGSQSCSDSNTQTLNGTLLSDTRVHASPMITGFDALTGSAPIWAVVNATGGSCSDDLGATLTISNSASPSCYQLRVLAGANTFTAQTNGSGIATITQGAGAYHDGDDVYFRISKTCGTNVTEAVNFSLSFHL